MQPTLEPHIWNTLQVVFAEALGFDEDEIEFGARVIDDLEAESIDLLDILYRLDQAFGIKIPRGGIEMAATGQGAEEGLDADGTLTSDSLARLSDAMPEVPREEFVQGLRPADIPKLFRVGTFYNLVVRLIAEKEGASA
jgi:acyl carrier protein